MKRYALVIVNNEFNAPRLTQLATPGRDAKLLVEVLEDQADCTQSVQPILA